eukprot:204553-Karenia_brevis.AAC.1
MAAHVTHCRRALPQAWQLQGAAAAPTPPLQLESVNTVCPVLTPPAPTLPPPAPGPSSHLDRVEP